MPAAGGVMVHRPVAPWRGSILSRAMSAPPEAVTLKVLLVHPVASRQAPRVGVNHSLRAPHARRLERESRAVRTRSSLDGDLTYLVPQYAFPKRKGRCMR